MIYVDTSVLVALLTNESTAPILSRWYAKAASSNLVTADWTLCEFASAVRLKERTGQLASKQVRAINKLFVDFLNGGIRLSEVSRCAFSCGAQLIQSMEGLRAGDALHLAVAMELAVNEFATLDKLLADKAKQAKLILVEF